MLGIFGYTIVMLDAVDVPPDEVTATVTVLAAVPVRRLHVICVELTTVTVPP